MRLTALRERRPQSGFVNHIAAAATMAAALLFFGLSSATAEEGGLAIELNKLEAQGEDCRAYFVIDNKNDTAYDGLKLDLVLFRPDGVIGQRIAVELAPLKPKKRTVKLYDVAGISCDEVGSFLINEVMECKTSTGEAPDCLQDISVSSRTGNQLTK